MDFTKSCDYETHTKSTIGQSTHSANRSCASRRLRGTDDHKSSPACTASGTKPCSMQKDENIRTMELEVLVCPGGSQPDLRHLTYEVDPPLVHPLPENGSGVPIDICMHHSPSPEEISAQNQVLSGFYLSCNESYWLQGTEDISHPTRETTVQKGIGSRLSHAEKPASADSAVEVPLTEETKASIELAKGEEGCDAALNSILASIFKHTSFRGKQLQIIQRVLKGQSTLAILPTGSFLCFKLQAQTLIVP